MNNTEMRPCIINVNEETTIKGLFYKWIDGGQEILALVEIQGGNVAYAPATSIRFIDSEYYFNQFDWESAQPEQMQTQEAQAENEVAEETVGD